MRVGVGYCDNPDTTAAGLQAVSEALQKAGRSDQCDVVLLFATARHDAQVLRDAVASAAGAAPIVGGGVLGAITNDKFGYAGDQVAAACLWLDGARCDIRAEGGLLEGEKDVGRRLGLQLKELGTTPQSPVILFYGAVDTAGGDVRMFMATWILAGIEQGLGFLPGLVGAGLLGDYVITRAKTCQWIGDHVVDHHAMAIAFSDDIHIDSVIMHGCRPSTSYYTVTKADNQVILEINGRPALEFLGELLGSGIPQESYPFFLILGVNKGEKWGGFDENNYASRLCLGLDKERGGIVMFEPDMVEGTEFQIMYRSIDLEYMKPRLEQTFDRLDGRDPVFALYIDCGGRTAGYGGIDMEDALVVQNIVADRVPVLGIYTGVEVASINGRPKGLDWTGIFCLFSTQKRNNGI